MAWNEHPSHRCEHCNHPVGRQIKIEFQGITVSNTRKTCLVCRKKGCLNCMTGNVKHGILHHKECSCTSKKGAKLSKPDTINLNDLEVETIGFRVITSANGKEPTKSEATIKLQVGKNMVLEASDGVGPVHALDNALRKALSVLFDTSALKKVQLVDYCVSVVDSHRGTAARVKVSAVFRNRKGTWRITEQGPDIIETSYRVLLRGLTRGFKEEGIFHERKMGW